MNTHVIGFSGMVGSELIRRGYKPMPCDITNKNSIQVALDKDNPSTIILCAAKTNVDWCEMYPIDAMEVNSRGPSNLVDLFRGRLVYISTDHIFDGKKFLGLGYHEKSSTNPVNVYGRTKLAGELMVGWGWSDTRIVRTSKLFNYASVMDKFYSSDLPYIFSGVLKRSYLHVEHFCDGLDYILNHWEEIPKILNIAGTDVLSEHMFMSACAKVFDCDDQIMEPRNKELKNVTPRPLRGGLNISTAKGLGVPLYSAFDGIKLL